MVRTRVGYTGGTKSYPTYQSLGNHTEALQVDFNPAEISFEEIVNLVWNRHNPTDPVWYRQYMSAIWYENEAQLEVIHATREAVAAQYGAEIRTPILALDRFYPAEDYHQKFYLQKERRVMGYFSSMYPDFSDFIDSTAAARLNGFVGGRGTKALLQAEIGRYGIPPEALNLPL